jgi:hypothetical protein
MSLLPILAKQHVMGAAEGNHQDGGDWDSDIMLNSKLTLLSVIEQDQPRLGFKPVSDL